MDLSDSPEDAAFRKGVRAWLKKNVPVWRKDRSGDSLEYDDPKRITRMLKKWEETGVDCVNFLLNANETVDQAQVLDSLRLFGREVMPHFQTSARAPRAAAS